jgi:Dolichyl-phosphate-mannose-protein mannosyltransferase
VSAEMEQTAGNTWVEASAGVVDSVVTAEIKSGDARTSDEVRHDLDHDWLTRWLVLAAVLLVSAVYVSVHLRNGWVPADEGTLAQSALRTMEGQLPHRDFGEIYTGGLSLLHALAFRVFGVTLMSLRICVFIFFLAWLPAFYSIAVRFTPPSSAGVITLLAVAWSYPNYPAAMPSWYNLFFATFGAAALLRYLDVRKVRWLYIAGICGGISILIKIIGAYYVAGALLFLVFVEQEDHESGGWKFEGTQRRPTAYRIFAASALLLFLAAILYLLQTRLRAGEIYDFVLPAAALVGLIFLSEMDNRSAGSAERFRALFRSVLPFLGGVVTPIAIFLVPYARTGSIRAIFSGVTSSAAAHVVDLGRIRPPGVGQSTYAVVMLGIVAAAMYRRELQSKLVGVCLGFALLILLYLSTQGIVAGVWYSVAMMTPLVVLAGAAILLRSTRSGSLSKLQRQKIMLLISLAAICSLVQFPFAAPIYLSYCLPLTLLAALAIVTTAKKFPGTYVLVAITGFYLLFGVVRLVPDYIYELTHKVGTLEELHIPRAAGLRVEFAPDVETFVHLLQEHAPNGLIYAGNDCPEVYFLTGLRNVTHDDSGVAPEEVLKAIDSMDVKEVVINEAPFFPGGRINPEFRTVIVRKFPESRRMGIFSVYWRP